MFNKLHIGYLKGRIQAEVKELNRLFNLPLVKGIERGERLERIKQIEQDLYDMRIKLKQLESKPRQSFASKMLVWVCLYALIGIAIAFLAGG